MTARAIRKVYAALLEGPWLEEVAATLERSHDLRIERDLPAEGIVGAVGPACIVTRLGDGGIEPRNVLSRYPMLPVVYLLDRPRTRLIVEAIKYGAYSVLEWPLDRMRLVSAVHEALAESIERQQRLAGSEMARDRFRHLTQGERVVLELALTGAVNKVIAKRLGVSLRTVEARRARVFKKLGTRSMVEIALIWRCMDMPGLPNGLMSRALPPPEGEAER